MNMFRYLNSLIPSLSDNTTCQHHTPLYQIIRLNPQKQCLFKCMQIDTIIIRSTRWSVEANSPFVSGYAKNTYTPKALEAIARIVQITSKYDVSGTYLV